MHRLRAKLEAISTQCCAFAQPHWHSQESLLQPCSVQTKFWPMDVRVALNCTKGSSLLLLVWGWMESHCIPSRFQPAAEVDTSQFLAGHYTRGGGSAGISCLFHSDSTGHCAMPPLQQEYHPHTWMSPSLCQRAQQAASLLLCSFSALTLSSPFPGPL